MIQDYNDSGLSGVLPKSRCMAGRVVWVVFNLSALVFAAVYPTHGAKASFLGGYQGKGDPVPFGVQHFVSPNEPTPEDAIPILRTVPKGLAVAVGTERGFIDLALATDATHLLLADYDQHVVQYNRVNIGLLAIARSAGDYRWLRTEASQSEWIERIGGTNLDPEILDALKSNDTFENWERYTRLAEYWGKTPINPKASKLAEFQTLPGVGAGDAMFANANYLWDSKLFARLAWLARNGRIEAHQVDFSNSTEVTRLVAAIKRSRIPLALFDLSNAWQGKYIDALSPPTDPHHNFNFLMRTLLTIGGDNSVLMTTHYRGSEPSSPRIERRVKPGSYNLQRYFGVNFHSVRRWLDLHGSLARMLDSMSYGKKGAARFGWGEIGPTSVHNDSRFIEWNDSRELPPLDMQACLAKIYGRGLPQNVHSMSH